MCSLRHMCTVLHATNHGLSCRVDSKTARALQTPLNSFSCSAGKLVRQTYISTLGSCLNKSSHWLRILQLLAI